MINNKPVLLSSTGISHETDCLSEGIDRIHIEEEKSAFHKVETDNQESTYNVLQASAINTASHPGHKFDNNLQPSIEHGTLPTAKLRKPRTKVRRTLDLGQVEVQFELSQQLANRSPPARPIMNPTRLFIASLGNPPPYSSTRHSAGHILVKALQSHLMLPLFQKSRPYANGLTSLGMDIGRPEFTLWQSPSLMNVSGVALVKAYKTFVTTAQTSVTDPLPGLVILYDEMETTPSQLRLRRGATSAKGHNGLKSVQQTLQSAGLMDKLGNRFVKIGIGIGRPAGGSRASEDVSQYVLGQLTGSERQAVDNKAGELVQLLEAEILRMSK